MNDFKGLARDMSPIKMPEQMWQYARNILLSNKYLSITNEKGDEYGYEIPGVVIGHIITNEDIVYFSIDGKHSCIGYVNRYNGVYVPVLRTINDAFKFKPSCPIEGIYIYNYKKELVIVFSDGVFADSSTPKLINIHKPQVTLTATKEFVHKDDYVMFELFNHTKLPLLDFTYEAGGLDAEVVHISFCYVYEDNTEGLYSPIIETVYPNYKGTNTQKRNVILNFYSFSEKFSKVKLAFILKKEGGIFAYTTPVLTLNKGSLNYTLASLEELLSVTPDEIVITPERLAKIKSLTKTANQVVVANVETKKEKDLQIYANKLELDLFITGEPMHDKYKTHPSLLPDEVYSISIIPIYKDGTKGAALHIPGRKANAGEREPVRDLELQSYGLYFHQYQDKGYRSFHFKNFGSVNRLGEWTFGYWENELTYPDKPSYNSSSIGGEDLRNTPIRYHRMPSFDVIETVYPNIRTSVNLPTARGLIDENVGYAHKFGIKVKNFKTVFPAEVLETLQAYELVIEKRTTSGTYVETNGFLYNFAIDKKEGYNYKIEDEDGTAVGRIAATKDYTDFTISNFISPETAVDKIDINAQFVKIYAPVHRKLPIVDKRFFEKKEIADIPDDDIWEDGHQGYPSYYPPTEQEYDYDLLDSYFYESPVLKKEGVELLCANIREAKYLLAHNIAASNRFGEERLELVLEEAKGPVKGREFTPITIGASDLNILYVSLITLNKNIYNLDNDDFISLGIVNLEREGYLIGGDCFTSSIIRKLFSTFKKDLTSTGTVISFHGFMNYYLYNSFSPLGNVYIINGMADEKRSNPMGYSFYRSWKAGEVNTLNSFSYETTVKNNVPKKFNDYVNALPYVLMENNINYFPYRVYKGLAIPSESLQTKNLRYFPVNSYYDMRNDRGEIIAIRGFNRGVYIQQRFSLFVTNIADKLNTSEAETYLGSSEIFDRIPEEVMYNDNIGYIGSNSQFACTMFKDGYVTVDEAQGKIFIIDSGLTEISMNFMRNYFKKVLPIDNMFIKQDLLDKKVKTDNPFLSVGYIVGFDEEYNRVIITKKEYEPLSTVPDTFKFDGEFYYDDKNNIVDYNNISYFANKSKTFSFALDSKTWVCEHDYYPSSYFYTNQGMYKVQNKVGENAKVYKANSDAVNPGNFIGVQHESSIDLIFNGRVDFSKTYQAVYWVSEAIDIPTGNILQFDTIDKVVLYNNHQCSGIIKVSKKDLVTSRNKDGIWQLNKFRDMLVSADKKVLDDDGNLITANIKTNKEWYAKNLFRGNYVTVRLIWDNTTKVLKHIHNINVKSVNS